MSTKPGSKSLSDLVACVNDIKSCLTSSLGPLQANIMLRTWVVLLIQLKFVKIQQANKLLIDFFSNLGVYGN